MRRVIQQRWIVALEQPVAHGLRHEAKDHQRGKQGPQGRSMDVIGNHHGHRKEQVGKSENAGAECGIEKQPIQQNGQGQHRSQADADSERVAMPQAQGQHRAQEQQDNPQDMHQPVTRIAMVFDIVDHLTSEHGVHGSLARQ